MKQIIVDILPDGTVKIEGVGFTDAECASYIEALQKALGGEEIEHKHKPEFHKRKTKGTQQIKQSG